ncbi:MAG TPA: hypothetical protein DDY13_03480 [Cytophagales bacterium]|jgi:hypothetical protein|nr:hypothetical protein [Cytophagales bacterium]
MVKNTLRIILITVLSGILDFSYGQSVVKVRDSINNETIPFVHVLSPEGTILTVTDQYGNIDISSLPSDLEDFTIKLQHISFQSKKYTFTANDDVTILMQPNMLSPVLVEVTGESKEKTHIVLKGYFRSYQTQDGIPKFYSDGFIEYYIPLESKKKSLAPTNVIEHRTYVNKELLLQDEARSMNVSIESFGPPFLYERPTTEDITKMYSVERKDNQVVISDNDEVIGRVISSKETNVAVLSVDIDFTNKEKIKKAFGYMSRFEKFTHIEEYSPANHILLSNSFDNLIKKQDYRKLHFKHKSEKNFKVIELVHEFYITERNYIDDAKNQIGNLVDYNSVKYSSNYQKGFLQRIDDLNLTDLPANISMGLDNTLIDANDMNCSTCN